MKKIILVIGIVVLCSAAWAGPYGPYSIGCNQIQSASYTGNSTNAPFRVKVLLTDGTRLEKVFHAPNAMENARQLVHDLTSKSCGALTIYYTRGGTPNPLEVTEFEVVLGRSQLKD